MKKIFSLCASILLVASSVAAQNTCDVQGTLNDLDSGAKLQRNAVINGLRNLKRLNGRTGGFSKSAGDAADDAYTNTLRVVLSVPFSIKSCQESSVCSKVDFTSSISTYNQSSEKLRDLGLQVAKKLARIKEGTRGAVVARGLRKKANALYNANLNGVATLSAANCIGGRANATPSATPNPEINSLLQTMVGHWNHVAINASGMDHSPLGAKEQMGPVRAARAEAIVHIAMFDAVNAATGQRYEPYHLKEVRPGASVEAAIAQASYDTLSKLFPSQASHFAAEYLNDVGGILNGKAKEDGLYLGKEAARLVLEDRANDGADDIKQNDPYTFLDGVGFWALDPLNPTQKPLGANWGKLVKPFVLPHSRIVRSQPFPAWTSQEYADAYAEVKRLGGDGVTTPTERTQDQTEAGLFWAYDGTPSLCAPPRLYNQIAMHIANLRGISDPLELTRLLALVNLSMADAGVASWETKYFYNIARPVTAIRKGEQDGNPNTVGDVSWTPLGAPATNLNGPNFTPPFPAYVSGHATFGGALFQTLRNYFGTDDIEFSFVSDELNGITPGNNGVPRPKRPRTFKTLSQAEEENGQSRIYLGIHWKMDKVEGIKMGRTVANYIYLNKFREKNSR